MGEFDTWGEWAPDGARNAAAWVATKGHLPRAEAGRLVKRARALPRFPSCAEAWRRGDRTVRTSTSSERCGTTGPKTPWSGTRRRWSEKAVGPGRFEDFVKAVGYWEQLADPDGTEEAAEERRNRRDVYLVQVGDMWLGKMTLDPIGGAIFSNELGRLEQELFEEDWKEAGARLGHEPTVADIARTPGQRRATPSRRWPSARPPPRPTASPRSPCSRC